MTRLVTLIFDHAQPKKFCESVSIYKKWVTLSVHSLDTVHFRVPSPDWSHPFLTMPTPKIFKQFLICINMYHHLLIPSVDYSYTINFRGQRPDCPHPFFNMLNQKIFNQLLIFMNLYQYAKDEVVSLLCSGEVVDFKILESHWLRAFWLISQKQDFSKYRICAKSQQII